MIDGKQMKKSTAKNDVPDAILKISNKLTIHRLVKFHQDNAHCLNQSSLNIDASIVNDIDTAALQLIAYYITHIKEHHGSVNWNPPPSPYFTEQVNLVGLKNVLI